MGGQENWLRWGRRRRLKCLSGVVGGMMRMVVSASVVSPGKCRRRQGTSQTDKQDGGKNLLHPKLLCPFEGTISFYPIQLPFARL